jgi:hypothetical protein
MSGLSDAIRAGLLGKLDMIRQKALFLSIDIQ